MRRRRGYRSVGSSDGTVGRQLATEWVCDVALSGSPQAVCAIDTNLDVVAVSAWDIHTEQESWWRDNADYVAEGAGESAYHRRSCIAWVELETNATEMAVEIVSTHVAMGSYPGLVTVGVQIDDAAAFVLESATAGTKWLSLPSMGAGTKTIRLWDGPLAIEKPGGATRGTFIVRVAVPAGATFSVVSPSTPSHRLVLYGDSGPVGFGADYPPIEGACRLLRERHPDSAQYEAWGYRALWDDCATPALRAAFVAKIAAMYAGVTTKDFLGVVGGNDYLWDTCTAAEYGAALAALLDDLLVALPDVNIYWLTALSMVGEAIPNGLGSTLQNYRDAAVSALAGRGQVGSGPDAVEYPTDFYTDLTHPNTHGNATLAHADQVLVGWVVAAILTPAPPVALVSGTPQDFTGIAYGALSGGLYWDEAHTDLAATLDIDTDGTWTATVWPNHAHADATALYLYAVNGAASDNDSIGVSGVTEPELDELIASCHRWWCAEDVVTSAGRAVSLTDREAVEVATALSEARRPYVTDPDTNFADRPSVNAGGAARSHDLLLKGTDAVLAGTQTVVVTGLRDEGTTGASIGAIYATSGGNTGLGLDTAVDELFAYDGLFQLLGHDCRDAVPFVAMIVHAGASAKAYLYYADGVSYTKTSGLNFGTTHTGVVNLLNSADDNMGWPGAFVDVAYWSGDQSASWTAVRNWAIGRHNWSPPP